MLYFSNCYLALRALSACGISGPHTGLTRISDTINTLFNIIPLYITVYLFFLSFIIFTFCGTKYWRMIQLDKILQLTEGREWKITIKAFKSNTSYLLQADTSPGRTWENRWKGSYGIWGQVKTWACKEHCGVKCEKGGEPLYLDSELDKVPRADLCYDGTACHHHFMFRLHGGILRS